MSGAEIIPIGTRGRPGRGSGTAKPSSAVRALAGEPASGSRRTAKKAAPKKAAPKKAAPNKAEAQKPGTQKPSPQKSGTQKSGTQKSGTAETVSASRPDRTKSTSTTTALPRLSIPVNDWLAAINSAALEVFGEDGQRRLGDVGAFLRRRLTGDYRVDEYGFDPELTERFVLAALRPIAEKWFRVEVRGIENIPTDGGALVVSNHSGTIPLDAAMTMTTIHTQTGRFLRPLGADLVFRLPVVSALGRKTGATLACGEDAERMLRSGELVGVWPEGFKGIGKPYSQRYKLQRFGRGGFVSAALRTGVPIVPVSVVGAEETYPIIGDVPVLARLLGVPYVPITPLFPWLGPLGMIPLPSKWLIEFGEPIRTDAYDAGAADDPMLMFDLTDQVRETIQQTLYQLLEERPHAFG